MTDIDRLMMATNHRLIKTAKGYLIVTPTNPSTEAAKALIEELKSTTGEEWAILVGTDLVSIELDFAIEWAEMSKLIDGIPHRIIGLTRERKEEDSHWRMAVEVQGRTYIGLGATHVEAVSAVVVHLTQAGFKP